MEGKPCDRGSRGGALNRKTTSPTDYRCTIKRPKPIDTNMSHQYSVSRLAESTRTPVGSRVKWEGPDPVDLEIRQSGASGISHCVKKCILGQCPNIATVGRKKPKRKLTDKVKKPPKAYRLLKPVADFLRFIPDDCEVFPPSRTLDPQCLRSFQESEVNTRAIASLTPRITTLSESLREPVPLSDTNEKRRGKGLKR